MMPNIIYLISQKLQLKTFDLNGKKINICFEEKNSKYLSLHDNPFFVSLLIYTRTHTHTSVSLVLLLACDLILMLTNLRTYHG